MENDLKNNKKLQAIIADLTVKFGDSQRQDLIEEIVQGNNLEFEFKDTKYKVSKPNFAKKQKTYQEKSKKYTALIQDRDLLLEADLKKMYKERGIDIDDLENQILVLERRKQTLQFKLGEALAKQNYPDSELKELKLQIEKLLGEQTQLSVYKSSLLEPAIEQQVFVHICTYLTYLVTEKLVDDKWIPGWTSFEEFMKSDDELMQQIAFYSSLIIREEIKG